MATLTITDIRQAARRAAHQARSRARWLAWPVAAMDFRAAQLSRLSRRLSPMLTLSDHMTAEVSETCPACHIMSEHAEGCELSK